MKRLVSLAVLAATLFSMNAFACDTHKSEGKDKGPQAQTTTGPSVPVAKDSSKGSK